MLEEILTRNEGKTLEFKENSQSLQKIIQTVIAFANTAGGI
ncbi:MAG: AlbA family DNA-binding domain-containing protein, partial [Parachlamydiaceae bacterium]